MHIFKNYSKYLSYDSTLSTISTMFELISKSESEATPKRTEDFTTKIEQATFGSIVMTGQMLLYHWGQLYANLV